MEALGIEIEKSLARIRETTEVIKLAFTGKAFSYRGEFFKLTDVEMGMKPVDPDLCRSSRSQNDQTRGKTR
jgi:alkanesulfonate monooxygenase SsuD/methylene tetrahydromethanopterin reductase-like flavin-dependent oxidoreductase (luciferase family)